MTGRWMATLLMTLMTHAALAVPFWGAHESRPPETAPAALLPGEFVWNPGVAPIGPIVVVVSLGEQRAYVYRNGVEIGYSTISSGKGGHDTPTGVFVILQKDKNHHSSKYNNAPMPYTQRLTWDGVALHAGGLPGYPSSHGCVHLPSKFSEELFEVSPMGMTVVVVDERSAPAEVAHPPAFTPVDPASGAPLVAEHLEADEAFRLEPEKAPHGPVSLLMSAADQRVLLLRNGVEIGRARISVRNPGEPLGTHAFVMTEDPSTGPNPWVPGAPPPTWVAIPMPGHFDEAGRALSKEAAARVSLPANFVRAIQTLLAPGTTLYVTDAPILEEHMADDFTVLANGAAPGSGET
jgi:hypothetical protein